MANMCRDWSDEGRDVVVGIVNSSLVGLMFAQMPTDALRKRVGWNVLLV